jgi:hypothetical protein
MILRMMVRYWGNRKTFASKAQASDFVLEMGSDGRTRPYTSGNRMLAGQNSTHPTRKEYQLVSSHL